MYEVLIGALRAVSEQDKIWFIALKDPLTTCAGKLEVTRFACLWDLI